MTIPFADIDRVFANLTAQTEVEKPFLEALMAISRQGHLCLSIDEKAVVPSLGDLDQKVREGAASFHGAKAVKCFGNLWYLQRNWVFETRVVEQLKRLLSASPFLVLKEQKEELPLNTEQKEAVAKALHSNVSLISGGPGTGKSYLIKHLVSAFLKSAPGKVRVLIAAPTGKAVSHLGKNFEQQEEIEYGTLHSLLGIRSSEDLNREGGALFADLLIVDECSMIDVRLFSYLLASVQTGSRLVLLGDKNQLPPVEAGSLFADLLEAEVLPSTFLKKCMRSDRAEILNLASAIHQGDVETTLSHLKKIDADWEIAKEYFPPPTAELPSPEELLEQMQRFCILSCIRQGPLGVDALNALLAERFQSEAKEGEWWAAPILITRTDYRQGIYNGQTGVLVRRCGSAYTAQGMAFFSQRSLPEAFLPSYEYAYALSVHKSQGSEYDKVLLLIPPGSEVFGREVLYTAVTRARKEIEIRGSEEVVREALGRSSRKISGIQARLKI